MISTNVSNHRRAAVEAAQREARRADRHRILTEAAAQVGARVHLDYSDCEWCEGDPALCDGSECEK